MTPYTDSYSPQQLEEAQFSHDKNFAKHGKIMLLVLVMIFSLFFVFILMIPCLKKRRARGSHERETGGDFTIAGQIRSTPSHLFLGRRKEDTTLDANSTCNTSRKFPL